MLINIPEDVAQRLEQLAQQQGESIGEILKTLLNHYAPDVPPGSLAEMARNAQEAGLASTQRVDTAEHSRDILNTEYADYLQRRLNNDPHDNHN